MNLLPGQFLIPLTAISLFLLGWICLLTQRNALKQVIGLKILLQGVSFLVIWIGSQTGNIYLAQVMVISALVVEAMVISLALSMIVSIFRDIPDGDIDQLRELRG
jgi:NADH:ubiquinone oxidoreductase subunit K